MVVNISYQKIFTTGLFADSCHNWCRRPNNKKTWANFNIEFSLAHQELLNLQTTICTGGFHAANLVEIHQDPPEALDNLAEAIISDRKSPEKLIKTNNQLVNQLS